MTGLAGRRVLLGVCGGIAAYKCAGVVSALRQAGADVHVISRSATRSVEAMTGITLVLREYRNGDLDGAWYAIAATDDPSGDTRGSLIHPGD